MCCTITTMGNKLRIALALVVLIVADRGQAILPRRLLDFDVKHAATAAFAESFPSSAGPTLLLTSFYPFGSDSVYAVVNISQVIQGHLKATLTVLDSDASWPNQGEHVQYYSMTRLNTLPYRHFLKIKKQTDLNCPLLLSDKCAVKHHRRFSRCLPADSMWFLCVQVQIDGRSESA